MNEKPSICLKNVWKIFGDDPSRALDNQLRDQSKSELLDQLQLVVALKDVSLEVYPGEVFVVMGLSGSGKSTLVRILLRLIEPTYGEILVDGKDILKYTKQELIDYRREKAAMIFQHFGLMPHRKVLSNAAWGLEVKNVDKASRIAQAKEVLATVGLQGWENRYPWELSGGMQQRVGIARALAVNPEILLMDEPFSGLDPLIRRELQDEFINIQQRIQKTVVFITHDLNEALKMGSRIAIMRDGSIIQIGTPEEIITNPSDNYVTEFTQDIKKASVLRVRALMVPPTADVSRESVAISPDATIESILALVVDTDRPLAVLDNGEIIGELHREEVLELVKD